MKQICYILTSSYDYRIVGVYCLESQFMEDIGKYFAGVTSSMATMCNIEIPFINVMTKMDLVENKGEVEKYMDPDSQLLMEESSKVMSSKFMELNKALVRVIDDNSIVSFIPLNIRDEDSIGYVVSHADNAIQYGEDEEPKEPQELEETEEYEEYEEYEQD
ncbi:GPN-loop GTPase 3 [Zancudomyces culisetae]|uniref:GPN-loop GTPase 3 n=1 Tax=Zancudomyces culisetae TaxID=1213189 RepID=A0A1R1PYY1_ZANCU|nr:GPN-loop GTPase 3 [Zancudomyces culisetae]|eukprot:OMH86153.1 GPN-loop GTPase 3 [Zancudomyces culisetae]